MQGDGHRLIAVRDRIHVDAAATVTSSAVAITGSGMATLPDAQPAREYVVSPDHDHGKEKP